MNERQHLDELLMAHAAGRLPEPLALIVATHLALSPEARARYGRFLALGGIFLEALEPAPLASDAWERLLDRLDEAEAAPSRAAHGPAEDEEELASLPHPLRTYLRVPPEGRCWRPLGGACELELRLRTPGFRTSLLRVGAGKVVPRHTQEGHELTLVLAGGFHDRTGHYRRGDLAIADPTIDRRPTADPDGDCLCLVVTDAPWRLTGSLGRLLNPFFRC